MVLNVSNPANPFTSVLVTRCSARRNKVQRRCATGAIATLLGQGARVIAKTHANFTI